MAGEINGTNILIQKGASPTDIFGQMEATLTMNGTPIDISNKSNGDFVTMLDAEVSSQQIVLTGTMIYKKDYTMIRWFLEFLCVSILFYQELELK